MIKLLNFNKILLLSIPGSIILSNGTYESWKALNLYQYEKENFKNIKIKIETASQGFAIGCCNGIMFSIFSPFIISGSIITAVHTYVNKK
jgi:hypothetical protein